MQIVIDIPEEVKHKVYAYGLSLCPSDKEQLINAIMNGTPLPKGHGRILDEKEILNTEKHDGGWYDLVDLPEYIAGVSTIIEADKESEDDE